MPKKLQKSLQACLSKIKNPTPPSMSSSKNWVFSGCKSPKTPSLATERTLNEGRNRDGAATLSDIDRFLFENFKSLYIKNEDEDHHRQMKRGQGEEKEKEGEEDGDFARVRSPLGVFYYDESPRLFDIPPDLCGSHRFFVTAGSSSSLIEEARLSLTATSEEGESSSSSNSNTIIDSTKKCNSNSTDVKNINVALPDDCITVIKYSKSPNDDFRQSMQEMVKARLQQKEKIDWDFMEELLFSYLDLNDKKSHKFILSAFVDLIVDMRQRSYKIPAKSRRSCRIARERIRRRKLRNVT